MNTLKPANAATERPDIRQFHSLAFDFDGVFTDNRVWVSQDGTETVCCDRRDGLAIDLLKRANALGMCKLELMVLSTESNPVVATRAKKLGLACEQSVLDKYSSMHEILGRRFTDETTPFSGLIYLGNDLNDLAVMREAGYAVAPADAHPRILDIADLVLPQKGGDGFVRAFVEFLLDIDNMMDTDLEKIISNR